MQYLMNIQAVFQVWAGSQVFWLPDLTSTDPFKIFCDFQTLKVIWNAEFLLVILNFVKLHLP